MYVLLCTDFTKLRHVQELNMLISYAVFNQIHKIDERITDINLALVFTTPKVTKLAVTP